MAKKIIKKKSIEETLWQSCDKLRGSVEPAEYKHVVLGFFFLKFTSDEFEERRKELIAEGKEKYVEMKDFYTMKNVQLTEQDIEKVALNYHNWQQINYKTTYKDIPEFCKSANYEDLEVNDFSLVPSKYIEFIDRDSGIDFDTEMKRIQKDFRALLQEEKDSQNQLIDAFKTLGYEL